MTATVEDPARELASFFLFMEGQVDLAGGNAKFRVAARGLPDVENVTIEIRVVDGVLYLRMPQGVLGVPTGRPWVRIDPAAASEIGLGPDQLAEYMGGHVYRDPMKVLDLISGAEVDRAQPTEEEELDGDAATVYRVHVALGDLLESQRGLLGGTGTIRDDAFAGTTEVPVDVWIDRGGRIRRIHLSVPYDDVGVPLPVDTSEATLDVSVVLEGFGAPVPVPVPPVNDTIDFVTAIRQAGAGTPGGTGRPASMQASG